jgi:hypothetical protein
LLPLWSSCKFDQISAFNISVIPVKDISMILCKDISRYDFWYLLFTFKTSLWFLLKMILYRYRKISLWFLFSLLSSGIPANTATGPEWGRLPLWFDVRGPDAEFRVSAVFGVDGRSLIRSSTFRFPRSPTAQTVSPEVEDVSSQLWKYRNNHNNICLS